MSWIIPAIGCILIFLGHFITSNGNKTSIIYKQAPKIIFAGKVILLIGIVYIVVKSFNVYLFSLVGGIIICIVGSYTIFLALTIALISQSSSESNSIPAFWRRAFYIGIALVVSSIFIICYHVA